MSTRISPKFFVASAVAFASLVLLVSLAPRAEAAEVKKFPAAGTVLWSSATARKSPNPRARAVTRLHQMRADGRPQIVHAIAKRRVGAVAEAKAAVTLKNVAGRDAIRFTAKLGGVDGNSYRVTIRDAQTAGEDEFVLFDGGTPLITLQYPEGSVGALGAQVNTYSLPVTASLLADGTSLAAASSRALTGGRDANRGTLWYQLNLPIRPFGQKGWVTAETVSLRHVGTSIIIHRRAKFLEVRRNGRRIFRAPVATGRSDRPTPLGNFYVAAKYRPPQNAAVSAYALELSAPAGLPDFLKGGVVGIHGTPLTNTIGKNASNGCIRVHNRTVMRLKALVPVGAPVKIVR
jgi:lipoprotein-anchoring transpeptidase ErfK/SrfK